MLQNPFRRVPGDEKSPFLRPVHLNGGDLSFGGSHRLLLAAACAQAGTSCPNGWVRSKMEQESMKAIAIVIGVLGVLAMAGAVNAKDAGCKFSGKWVDASAGGYPIFDCPEAK